MSFNILAALGSLLAGLIYFDPGEMMYRSLRGIVPGPALIAMYFFGLALCVFLVIFLLSKIMGNYKHLHYTFGKTIAMVLLFTCIGVPIVSAGTEFLYELGIQEAQKPKNYVFLVDNSGTMSANDPTNKRKDVVEEVANSLPSDVRIGVYTFDSETKEVFRTGAVSSGSVHIPDSAIYASGTTNLYSCISDVANSMPADMTLSPSKFIVLTDGDPSDRGLYSSAVNICNQKNISISCVGFGEYNVGTFVDLANRTGGNFMPASDVTQLKGAVSEVINKNPVNRDLISSRVDNTSNSWVYGALRILFLILIGLVFAYLKYLNAALPKFSLPFFIACTVSVLLGGIFVEVFYRMYLVESLGRLVLCLTFAFTPLLSNKFYTTMSGVTAKTNPYGNDSYGNDSYTPPRYPY